MSKRTICVINGKGGIGKDTLIDALAHEGGMTVYNISSIDPIRDLCAELTKGCKKDLEQRKLLSGMKELVDEYYKNEHGISYTQKYLQTEINKVLAEANVYNYDNVVIFIHIREPENIKTFLEITEDNFSKMRRNFSDIDVKLTTLLIESDRAQKIYGNSSDENVADFDYDYIFTSNNDKETDAKRFIQFMKDVTRDKENKINSKKEYLMRD